MSLKRQNKVTVANRFNQQRYTGEIPKDPDHYITCRVNHPVKSFTITFDPKLLQKKIEKYGKDLILSPKKRKTKTMNWHRIYQQSPKALLEYLRTQCDINTEITKIEQFRDNDLLISTEKGVGEINQEDGLRLPFYFDGLGIWACIQVRDVDTAYPQWKYIVSCTNGYQIANTLGNISRASALDAALEEAFRIREEQLIDAN